MIVEDFTGLPDADSYVSLSDADAFHTARGNTAWGEASSDARNAALIRATDYIEQTYEARRRRLNAAQALQWPTRAGSTANAIVKRVTMLLALEALTTALSERIERGSLRQLDKLDGVGMTETYFDTSPIIDHYPHITAMIRDIATLRRAGVQTGRVSRREPFDPAYLNVTGGFGGNGFDVFGGWDIIE